MDPKLLWAAVGALCLLVAGVMIDALKDHHVELRELDRHVITLEQRLRQLEACHHVGLDGTPFQSCPGHTQQR